MSAAGSDSGSASSEGPVLRPGQRGPSGKRSPPTPIEPIVVGNTRYEVPHFAALSTGMTHNGGYVEAIDVSTGRRRWLKEVYRYTAQGQLEPDVQDVFITQMRLEGGILKITDEQGFRYDIPLTSK